MVSELRLRGVPSGVAPDARIGVDLARRDAAVIALGAAAVLGAYLYTDFTFPLTPGNSAAAPLGWLAWDDQHFYLMGAQAFLRGDLDQSQHFYPPLYPLLAAPFLKLWPQAPFFWPDLALTLAYFGLFVALFRRYLGVLPAVACALAGMMFYADLRVQWLMPWTTTPAAPLLLGALLLFDRAWRRRDAGETARASALNAAGFGLCLGLLAADRPIDVAVAAPIWLAYAAVVLLGARAHGLARTAATAAAGVAGVASALVPYVAFNLVSSGNVLGRYFAQNEKLGFDPSVLPMALYSHLVASAPWFAEPHADWASRIPLVLLAVLVLPACLAWGPLTFRLAAACGLTQFLIYYCDHDIVPTGTFRFCNIHYFKWLAPVALALAFHAARAAASPDAALRRRGAASIAFVVAAALAIACLAPTASSEPVAVAEEGPRAFSLALPGERIDYIDVAGPTGAWSALYFPRGASVEIDGAAAGRVRDWRFLPTAQGFRILLPGRPAARRLTFRLPDDVQAPAPGGLRASAARVHWTLRLPGFGGA